MIARGIYEPDRGKSCINSDLQLLRVCSLASFPTPDPNMTLKATLNCDCGESFGQYTIVCTLSESLQEQRD